MRLSDPDDQAELDALMAEAWPVLADSHDTARCAARMRTLLEDAAQAHRPWATAILDRAVLSGLGAIGKAWAKKHNRVILPIGSPLSSVARRVGARRCTGGSTGWQQCLIETLTWVELERAISDIEHQIGSLMVNGAAKQRLLDLRHLHPKSTCPADAARLAGTTVDAVMAGEWAAA